MIVCTVTFFGTVESAYAISIKVESQSEHVLDLQQRLSALGYFKAGLTGYYGPATAEAVRRFQKAYRLPVDGEVDSTTFSKIQGAVSPKNSALEQLARIIYSEARGESFEGQVAVGAVVLNRVQSPLFPDSITEVIFQKGQFSAVDDGQYWLTPNQTAYQAAKAALNGWDPARGTLYYHNPKITTSTWSLSRPKVVTIGKHVFTR
ncbi:cell wall hydrolase [Paenibacillus cremeus]|uniref:Cell wall hydrolase n=2 Tax=Paenibacillus cremeus TaxID=2163881 RepID=A0A559J967_9BACL|nr:cell wall hydrolase [Paenibacillus cremeus]TVX96438.1 cell wall hydrolase [Paenibacillus cremeus]